MKKMLMLVLYMVLPTALSAQRWTVKNSKMEFEASMFGVDVNGKFKGFRGSVVFDPAHPEAARISGSVDATTLSTGNNLRDRHLKEKDQFFEVAKYPRISMESVKVEKTGTGYVGTFRFTVKTVTRNVKIPFSFIQTGSNAVMKGEVQIDRDDWKFGGNTWGMSDDVKLLLELHLAASS